MSKQTLEPRALAVCVDYERWASEVSRLTDEIATTVCPHESLPEEETHWNGSLSCFQDARENLKPVIRRPDDGPRPPYLSEIAAAVKDCPSCSRLCAAIRERREARQRLGVAKRRVRVVGKLGSPSDTEEGS